MSRIASSHSCVSSKLSTTIKVVGGRSFCVRGLQTQSLPPSAVYDLPEGGATEASTEVIEICHSQFFISPNLPATL